MATLGGATVPDREGDISSEQWDFMPGYDFAIEGRKPGLDDSGEIRRPCTAEGELTYARIVGDDHIMATYCNSGLRAGNTYKSRFTV